jgi:hypothetical protein
MRRLAIEINDAGLVIADENAVLCSEPGYAVVERGQILTGREAFSLARLKPRSTSFRHWSDLSIEAGSAAVPGKHSTAGLAHAQLDRLWRAFGAGVDQVVFVVPSTFSGGALSVLLGLAEECGMPAGAIVDVAVAASIRPWPERQLIYVDADLHGVFVTPLEQGEQVTALAAATLSSMGLAGLMDAFARRIAELFVLATRFDPFHDAATEQRLYDSLAAALASLDSKGRANITIADDGETFEIAVERSELLAAVQGFYRAVRQLIAQSRRAQSGLVVQLSDRLAGLPGLEEELARLDAAELVALEPGHAARAVLAAADVLALDDPAVKFFRHLPWRAGAAEPEVSARPRRPESRAVADADPRPTHIVYCGVAYPINGEGVVIGRSKLDQRRAILIESRVEGVSRAHCELAIVDGELRLRDLSSFGTFVNERRIDGEEILKTADIIRVGSPGAELTVVRVEDLNGA